MKIRYFFLIFFFSVNVIPSERHLQSEEIRLITADIPACEGSKKPTFLEPEYWARKFCPYNETIDPCSLKRCWLRSEALFSWPFTLIACCAAGFLKGASESCEAYRIEKEDAAQFFHENQNICSQCWAQCNYTIAPICACCLNPLVESCNNGCTCCILSFTTIFCDDCTGSTLNHNVHQ